MCLYCRPGSDPKVATEDIVCWKVLKRNKYTLVPRTPYHLLYVTRDQIEGREDFVPERPCDCFNHPSGGVVGEGFIHVHLDRNNPIDKLYLFNQLHAHLDKSNSIDKLYCFNKLSPDEDDELLIYECVIPKGTVYYEGTDNGHEHVRAAAAERIRFVRQINPSEKEQEEAHKHIVERIQETRCA